MMPEDTLSTTARATAACAGPNICTACVAFLMVTLLKRSVSGFAGRLGVTTASSLVKPSVLLDRVFTKACPAWPDFDPMIRSMWAISLPSPTRDSPMKKSAAITTSRSGWGPRVSLAGRHECGVESSVARGGVESHAVPRLRVAPTEPYRWGANLPAAPTGVKPAGRARKMELFRICSRCERPAWRDATWPVGWRRALFAGQRGWSSGRLFSRVWRQNGHANPYAKRGEATRPLVRGRPQGCRNPLVHGRPVEREDGVGLFGRGLAGHGPASGRRHGDRPEVDCGDHPVPSRRDRADGQATRSRRQITSHATALSTITRRK